VIRSRWYVFALALACLVVAGPTTAFAAAPSNPPGPKRAAKASDDNNAQTAALAKRYNSKLDAPIALTDGARKATRTRRELGIRLDLARMKAAAKNNRAPLYLIADKSAMKDALERIAAGFRYPARNAKPYVYRGQVRIDTGAYSRALNVSTTAERLSRAIYEKPNIRRFTVSLDKKPPVLTAARLRGINGVIGTFSTTAAPNAKRNHNIALSVGRINGALLSPGETFSLNDTVGERTHATGFLTAPVFEDGEKVPGIGGGVSQVTGTLFNAAALAGLKINEVYPHSRPVAYIPIGRDATVAYGAKDLRFTNNTKAPVYISYTFRNQRLTATFFGQKAPGRRVSLRPRVKRNGPGNISAELYRVVKVKGKVARKERLFTHRYKWEPDKNS
jgi:vancomycin resistance protein YoaR